MKKVTGCIDVRALGIMTGSFMWKMTLLMKRLKRKQTKFAIIILIMMQKKDTKLTQKFAIAKRGVLIDVRTIY